MLVNLITKPANNFNQRTLSTYLGVKTVLALYSQPQNIAEQPMK